MNNFIICLKTAIFISHMITILMFMSIFVNHKEFINYKVDSLSLV